MKTKKLNIKLIATMLLGAVLFASCSSDDPAIVIDKTALQEGITAAELVLSTTTEGTAAGEYLIGSKATLQTAIDAATVVADNVAATQAEVTNVTVSLANAVTEYEGKIIEEIDPDNLIAYWKFDEGSGTTVADASGNSHDGTFFVGHSSLGGAKPTWTTDRKGDALKAIHFTKGGHIEVPASAAFSPAELSITVWVKLAETSVADCEGYLDPTRCNGTTFKDNYILSQNDWSGYKFQTQDDRYPFFTAHATPDNYLDRASNVNLELLDWYQLAITFKDGTLKFYINGEDVTKPDDVVAGTFFTLADRYDFSIGQAVPNANVDPGISWTLGHFEGDIDEVRMYKKFLSPLQISAIYDQEKP